ncbi:uncharacterized protein LOC128236604 isoform X2 [Mya arenaria]|uniref:uncharacterized protein LOC128236604 isoform X2 n=1 Tax=Mya arenaria TaxID=6604 RepID=UPI0022E7EBD4|nr:uncharacterized protein LOC128236604 isoform X2 [Mya arenaria]
MDMGEIDRLKTRFSDTHRQITESREMCVDILRRLNELLERPHICPCTDEVLQAKEEIGRLQIKIQHLEDTHTENERRCSEQKTQVSELNSSLTLLQNDLTRLNSADDSVANDENVSVLENKSKGAANISTDITVHTKDDTELFIENERNTIPGIVSHQSKTPLNIQNEGGTTLRHEKKTANTMSKINPFASAEHKNDQVSGNERSSEASTRGKVEIVRQRYQGRKLGKMEWDYLMRQEMLEGEASGIKDLGGVHNVVLLDISESMEETWPHVATFFNDYLSGLEVLASQGLQQEHVALVTFGHETKVQQRLTNKYRSLKTAFSRLKVGGPSPLTAGIMMTFAAAGSSNKQVCVMNGMVVPTRVIIITDGEPTDTSLYMGPDEATPSKLDEIRSQVINEMEQARKFNLDVFFVPVGKANREFINLMAEVVNGKVISHQDGNQMSKRTLLTIRLHSFVDVAQSSDIKEIKRKSISVEKLIKNPSDNRDSYKEKSYCDLPVQGSRVRRGPDWPYKEDHSQGLAGTIVGHCDDGQRVWVDWDTPGSYLFHYRYGQGGSYEVILVDEQRRLDVGEIMAVGCHVKPGLGWKSSNTDIGLQCVGVVLRLHMTGAVPKALVRWEKGARGEYSYMTGSLSLPEIQLVIDGTPANKPQDLKPVNKQVRNKNKH